MLAGDYDRDGHHPWPHSPGDVIERIAHEWLTDLRGEVPALGSIAWFSNTEAGNEVALHVLAREG